MTQVFVLNIEPYKGVDLQAQWNVLLPKESLLKFQAISNLESRLSSALGELLARYAIAKTFLIENHDIKFELSENGKPFISNHENVYFNISHSGNFVVCATSEKMVGVDIERIRKVNYQIAKRFFSAIEQSDLFALADLDRQNYFFTLWTIKESYLKAIGRGLTLSLNSFTVLQDGSGFKLSGKPPNNSFLVKLYPVSPAYKLAVCSLEQHFGESLIVLDLNEISNTLTPINPTI